MNNNSGRNMLTRDWWTTNGRDLAAFIAGSIAFIAACAVLSAWVNGGTR